MVAYDIFVIAGSGVTSSGRKVTKQDDSDHRIVPGTSSEMNRRIDVAHQLLPPQSHMLYISNKSFEKAGSPCLTTCGTWRQ